MTMQTNGTRWMAMVLAATLALATVAPAAEAGRRYKVKRHQPQVKVTRVVHRSHGPRVVVHRYRHEPSFAGFIGGLFVGAALSHIAHEAAYADDGHYYYDPYCHERFVSLEVYSGHFRQHHHPRVIRVVTVSDHRWVDSMRYDDGRWGHCESDWNGGDDWGYYED